MNNKNPKEIVLFLASLAVSLLFFSINSFDNIYEYAVVGAIYEMVWGPTLACVILLPFANGYFWLQAKFSFKSLYLYGLLITTLTFVIFLQKIITES